MAMLFPAAADAPVLTGSECARFVAAAGNDPNGFAIFDMSSVSYAPAILKAKAVVLASFNNRQYKAFLSQRSTFSIMPAWRLEECKEAYEMLNLNAKPHLHDWETGFHALGGVPRWVLDHCSCNTAKAIEMFHGDVPRGRWI